MSTSHGVVLDGSTSHQYTISVQQRGISRVGTDKNLGIQKYQLKLHDIIVIGTRNRSGVKKHTYTPTQTGNSRRYG